METKAKVGGKRPFTLLDAKRAIYNTRQFPGFMQGQISRLPATWVVLFDIEEDNGHGRMVSVLGVLYDSKGAMN